MPKCGNSIQVSYAGTWQSDFIFMPERGNSIQVSYAGTWQPIPVSVSDRDTRPFYKPQSQSQCIFSQSYNKR
uniref:Uncharacterized protein n=1 Tax=Solanum tuberosum TaxID=4113 RepID=M1D3R0_SOLTU